MQVLISSVRIPDRVRKDMGNIESLMESMRKCGQLNPITITREMELVAGHRRITAATRLGWKMIDAVIVDGADETRRLEMEMEENFCRKDFSPEELLEGYKRLDALKHPGFGKRMKKKLYGFFSKLAFWKHKEKRPAQDFDSVTYVTGSGMKHLNNAVPEQPAASDDSSQYGV